MSKHKSDQSCSAECAACSCAADFTFSPANPADKKINGEFAVRMPTNSAKLLFFSVGALFFAAGIFLPLHGLLELIIFAAAYLLWGSGVLLKAGRNIIRGSVFDENFLMSIATLGAFAIGEYPEGVAVMVFYQVGEMLQGHAVNRSRKSIQQLMDIRPDYAHLKDEDGGIQKVFPDLVKEGDIIMVFPGERIPLDGMVLDGSSSLDVSALTGESFPREISAGDEVLSGSVNNTGLLKIQVTKIYKDSTVSRILSLVEEAAGRKAQTERFITRFARYYTPVVVAAAILLAFLPPLLFPGETFSTWTYRALVFLVISCPCALVISIPLGFFGGIGGASRKGILVKGGTFLEALSRIDTVIFDKTGTLTRGSFEVNGIYPSDGFNERELLRYGAAAASCSSHPVAVSILRAWGAGAEESTIHSFEEIPGHGVRLITSEGEVLMGNGKLMERHGIPFLDQGDPGTQVHLAVGGRYAGRIMVSDEIREDSADAVRRLKNLGVRKIVMLTGDRKPVAEEIGRRLGLDLVFSELLPHQKVEMIEKLQQEGGGAKKRIAFVGDGINDAPALARADIGVAMGGIGSDAAVEAADVVLMTAEPSKLAEAITIARKTRSIVIQNVVFALGIKALILLLGAAGMASMWEAVFADVGVTLLAVLNAMRAMR
ncbi:MAG: heavy metal translocating P-type ATPase [Bacillota bacterium]|nr:heavy metal translocating P-type ATPase [Bacillota bacterium]